MSLLSNGFYPFRLQHFFIRTFKPLGPLHCMQRSWTRHCKYDCNLRKFGWFHKVPEQCFHPSKRHCCVRIWWPTPRKQFRFQFCAGKQHANGLRQQRSYQLRQCLVAQWCEEGNCLCFRLQIRQVWTSFASQHCQHHTHQPVRPHRNCESMGWSLWLLLHIGFEFGSVTSARIGWRVILG